MWINPQLSADFFTFTEKILNKKTSFFVQWRKLDSPHLIRYKKMFLRNNKVLSSYIFPVLRFPNLESPVSGENPIWSTQGGSALFTVCVTIVRFTVFDTVQKMKVSIKGFFSKYYQVHSFLHAILIVI